MGSVKLGWKKDMRRQNEGGCCSIVTDSHLFPFESLLMISICETVGKKGCDPSTILRCFYYTCDNPTHTILMEQYCMQ